MTSRSTGTSPGFFISKISAAAEDTSMMRPAACVGAAIVNAHFNAPAVQAIGHAYEAAKRQVPMRRCQSLWIEPFTAGCVPTIF